MSAAASTSGSRSLGCMSTNGRWPGPRPRPPGSARAEPPPLMTNTTSGRSARAPGRVEHQVERLREADVAGVHHDPLARRGRTRAGRRRPRGPPAGSARCRRSSGSPGCGRPRRAPCPDLGPQVVAQVVGQDGDGVGPAVARTARATRPGAMTCGLVSAPSSTATSGKTSWMLNTNGTRHRRAASHPARPRVSGGDMASTTSGRPRRRPAAASAVDRTVNPPKASGPGRDVASCRSGTGGPG